jgi:hypothetical protein
MYYSGTQQLQLCALLLPPYSNALLLPPFTQADVVNRGFGGYFTSWFVDYMLEDLFNVANPTMVVLFLGTKDTLTPAVSG